MWGRDLMFRENCGPHGADRVVRWLDHASQIVSSCAVGSPFFGFGAPSWCALDDERAALVRSDGSVAIVARDGQLVHEYSLDEGVSRGFVRRVSNDSFVLIANCGPSLGRKVECWTVTGENSVLFRTEDFMSDLVVSEDGKSLAWLQFAVGTRPWEQAHLWRANFNSEGALKVSDCRVGPLCAQPFFVGSDLFVCVEIDEWWSLVHVGDTNKFIDLPPADYRPDGSDGRGWMAPLSGGLLLGAHRDSRARFYFWRDDEAVVEVHGGPSCIHEMLGTPTGVVVLGSTTVSVSQLWHLDATSLKWTCWDDERGDGKVSGEPVFGRTRLGVPYVRRDAQGTKQPGLVVSVHGGPTACASFEFSWLAELVVRAGFTFVSVDHRGSTSYGRAHREALAGHWGEFDVADLTNVIDELVASGEFDPDRVFVRGSSAGAMTALLASCHHAVRGVVATSSVTDLALLARAEDEFSTGEVAHLTGASTFNDALYESRSPLSFVSQIARRVLLLHSVDDPVVNIEQARTLAQRLRETHHEVELLEFEGEGHSIRHSDNVRAAYERELAFYAAR